MWTSEQQAEFEARGLVRLPAAFSQKALIQGARRRYAREADET